MIAAAAAQAAASGSGDASAVLIALVAILVGTRLLGRLAERFGQPAVLGELIAGVLLGGSVLGLVDPSTPALAVLSGLGVIVLLFSIGLETELASLLRVGRAATRVAVIGVVVPFVLGYYLATAVGAGFLAALVCAAALCATSVGITARVLADVGRLESIEGRVILGAAVIDDILGLLVLVVVSSIITGRLTTAEALARTVVSSVMFVLGALVIGRIVAGPLFRWAERLRSPGVVSTLGLAIALLVAWLANAAGSATIVGAFMAGVVLYRLPQRHEISESTVAIGRFLIPIFFACVGAAVDVRQFANASDLALGATLVGVGIVGKVVAGWGAFGTRADKLLIGLGMIPRGEVGLVVAQMGLSINAVNAGQYSAIMLMVLVTTLVTPPALAWRASRSASRPPSS